MHASERSQNLESLHGQFSSGYDNQGTKAIVRTPSFLVKTFDDWNEIAQSLTATCSCTHNKISTCNGMGNCSSLNFCHLYKFGFVQTIACSFGKRQVTEPNLDFRLIISLHDFPISNESRSI